MTDTLKNTAPDLGNVFAEVLIFGSKEMQNQIAEILKQSAVANQIYISPRSGVAPPAPGTYSK